MKEEILLERTISIQIQLILVAIIVITFGFPVFRLCRGFHDVRLNQGKLLAHLLGLAFCLGFSGWVVYLFYSTFYLISTDRNHIWVHYPWPRKASRCSLDTVFVVEIQSRKYERYCLRLVDESNQDKLSSSFHKHDKPKIIQAMQKSGISVR